MQVRNSRVAWGGVQQFFHWFIVAAVALQLTAGFIMANLPENDPSAGVWFGTHATLGVTILAVMLLRLLWRFVNPVPPLPSTLGRTQARLARAAHWALYALVIAMPLGGWLLVNAEGYPIPFFGIDLPTLIGKNHDVGEIIESAHEAGAFIIIALVIVHAAAALRHELLLKDNVFRRMTPLPLRTIATAAEAPAVADPEAS